MRKHSTGENIFNVFNILLMLVLVTITLYPLLYVLFASFSEGTLLMRFSGLLTHPLGFSTQAYTAVFKNPNIVHGYGNTLFLVVTGTGMGVLLTVIGGYCLSRQKMMWRNVFMLVITFTMFFNGGLIPNFLNVQRLGLLDTLAAVLLPTAINTFNLIIMRTAFMSIPDSLIESAELDGASQLIILFRIALPLALPTIMVIVLYYAVERWNEWFNAMIYLQDREKFPIALVLREILIQESTSSMTSDVGIGDKESISLSIKYAVIVIATVPILVLYPFLQKYFVKGVMVGAVKG